MSTLPVGGRESIWYNPGGDRDGGMLVCGVGFTSRNPNVSQAVDEDLHNPHKLEQVELSIEASEDVKPHLGSTALRSEVLGNR